MTNDIFMKRILKCLPQFRYKRQTLFDQRDTPGVSSARKWRDQPRLHNFENQFFRQHSLAQRKNVAVIVFARQPRGFDVPAQRATNPADFIRDNCLPVARTSKHDAALAFAASHSFSRWADEQGIINRLRAECAEILDVVTESTQENLDFLLVFEAGMVGTDRDLHGRKNRVRKVRLSSACGKGPLQDGPALRMLSLRDGGTVDLLWPGMAH